MKCKKTVMGIAALMIIVFHFWILLSPGMAGKKIEQSIINTTYIGVDLFFLVSGYSLGLKKQIKYGQFVLNRFLYIYLPFAFLAIVCKFYKGWKWSRLGLVLCGAEFFKKGGGAFLWFVTGICLVYLLAPFMVKLKNRLKWWALPILIGIWAVLVVLLQYAFGYTTIHILLNRLPVFFLGMYYDDFRKILLEKKRWPYVLPIMGTALVGGCALIYRFGGMVRLNVPISEMYYVIALPAVVSLVFWIDFWAERSKIKNVPLEFVGGITLEIYGLQMVFGYDIEGFILTKLLSAKMQYHLNAISNILLQFLSFIMTLLLLVLMAWLFSQFRKLVEKLVKKLFARSKKANRQPYKAK